MHASFVVQTLPSLHDPPKAMWTQPTTALQESFVHGLPSSQLGAGPPTQTLSAQTSFVVHALLSLHGALLPVWMHPAAGTHASSVHGLLSLQFGAGPPTHMPPEQTSFVVQLLLSLHGAV